MAVLPCEKTFCATCQCSEAEFSLLKTILADQKENQYFSEEL